VNLQGWICQAYTLWWEQSLPNIPTTLPAGDSAPPVIAKIARANDPSTPWMACPLGNTSTPGTHEILPDIPYHALDNFAQQMSTPCSHRQWVDYSEAKYTQCHNHWHHQ
jgi:hypothetical protein